MLILVLAFFAVAILSGLITSAFLPARPTTLLAFGGVLVGADAVFTFASGSERELLSMFGVAVVVAGVVVAMVGVRRDSRPPPRHTR